MNQTQTPTYIYLHGFASNPKSIKAVYFKQCFSYLDINLHIPDLNQGDFSHLTLTRQLQQIESDFLPAVSQGPPSEVTLIGSSFGGLTSAWLGQRQFLAVTRLVLLAPALQFMAHWLPKLGEEALYQWQTEGYFSVYHYGEQGYLPLNYNFVVDMAQYPDAALLRPIPTLMFHGTADETIPIQASREFAAMRSWVQFIELESDHSLGNVLPEIWSEIQRFCQLKNFP